MKSQSAARKGQRGTRGSWVGIIILFLALMPGGVSVHAGSGTITGNSADAQVNSDGTVTRLTDTYDFVGGSSGTQSGVVYAFQIPATLLGSSTEQFTSATFTMKLGSYAGSDMTVNGDLYGLGYSNTPTVFASDYYEGALDSSNMLIKDNLLTSAIPAYATVTLSNTSLVDYLNGSLAAARADGASSAYVFLRVSPDAYIWFKRYVMGMAESGASTAPTLSYVSAPVSGWTPIPLGGGGFVTGLVSDASGSDLYARTDVGGIFKWNSGSASWTSITDKIVPSTSRYTTIKGLVGAMSVAVDPSDANKIYAALGGGSVSGSNAGIYASGDKGLNWNEITTGTPNFSINGNGPRAVGERLTVDPNNPNLVWYGSETSGLMKGVKSGSTWTWSQIPSTSLPFGVGGTGISFVVCDKNGSNTITYAGVNDSSGGTGGVYRSTDGITWTLISGLAITSPGRAAVASDGTLFVTGNDVVAKMPRGGSFSSIRPVAGKEYRGLAINSTGTIVHVSNVSAGTCEIWRSSDSGTTWKTQSTAYFNNWNISASRIYASEPDGSPCPGYQWFGNVAALWLNPANSNELWASDFYGVQKTTGANLIGNTAVNTQPVWYRVIKNLEETLVFAIKNAPAGNRLVTGLADVGGYRYSTTIDQRPLSTNGGGLNATSGKNVTSIDFSEGSNSNWAYAWALDTYIGTGAVSSDGGTSWMRFGQIARRLIPNSSTAAWETFDLGNYLAKQKAAGVTQVTLLVAGTATWWEDTPSMTFESSKSTNTNKPKLVLNGGATVLTPIADTYVYKNAATTNYGDSDILAVRGNGGYDTWSYLKFDLSSVGSITTAQLQLYRKTSTDTHTIDVGVHACSNTTWVEGDNGTDNLPANEMVWNNKPYALSDGGTGSPLTATPDYRQGSTSLRGGRIAVSATDPTVMAWLPIGSTARYTEDRGVTWKTATGAPASQITGVYTNGNSLETCGQNLASDRVNGNFYMATFGGTLHTIYRSIDGAKTWTQVSTVANGGTYNMRTPQLMAAPVSPACPAGGDLWLCDDSSYNENTGGGLWRSVNGGDSFAKITTVGRVMQVGFGKSASGTGYAVYVHGEIGGLTKVYRSDDYGATWIALQNLPSTVSILSLTGDRQNFGKVFMGTGGRGAFVGQ